jgi:hypothetical protein
MKRGKPDIPLRPTDKSEQPWADVLETIADMREALERIGCRDAPRQLARQALTRFDNLRKGRK